MLYRSCHKSMSPLPYKALCTALTLETTWRLFAIRAESHFAKAMTGTVNMALYGSTCNILILLCCYIGWIYHEFIE